MMEAGKAQLVMTFLLCLAIAFALSEAKPEPEPEPEPPLTSFKINITLQQRTETASSCPYTVTIRTSCSSTRYTRDRISLAFGDAYGYQVYVPRLDDPRSRTFESCSTDTFHINGPCTYQICYVYLYRNGYDGWKPESITISGYYTSSVTFYYNTFIPNAVWFGFNHCHAALASS